MDGRINSMKISKRMNIADKTTTKIYELNSLNEIRLSTIATAIIS